MSVIYRNDCNGCADCQHCGLDKDYPVRICDYCGVERNVDDACIFRYDGQDLCQECLIDYLIRDGLIYEVDEDDEQ